MSRFVMSSGRVRKHPRAEVCRGAVWTVCQVAACLATVIGLLLPSACQAQVVASDPDTGQAGSGDDPTPFEPYATLVLSMDESAVADYDVLVTCRREGWGLLCTGDDSAEAAWATLLDQCLSSQLVACFTLAGAVVLTRTAPARERYLAFEVFTAACRDGLGYACSLLGDWHVEAAFGAVPTVQGGSQYEGWRAWVRGCKLGNDDACHSVYAYYDYDGDPFRMILTGFTSFRRGCKLRGVFCHDGDFAYDVAECQCDDDRGNWCIFLGWRLETSGEPASVTCPFYTKGCALESFDSCDSLLSSCH